MAEKEIYRLEVNVGITGDEKTKKRLSAMDKYTEKSEKRMRMLDKIEASPAVKLEDKLSGPLKKIEGRLGSFTKRAVKRFTAIAAAGAILVGGFGLGSTMQTFMDYEQGLANVRAVTNATAEEMKILSDEARRLGRDTVWSAVQVTEAEQLLAQAGFSVQETVGALPGLLSLASAGGLDLAAATDVAAGTLRSFGLEATQAGHVANVLAVAANATNSDVSGLGEAMKYVGPAANAMGVDLEQTTAALGMLHDASITGSQAGTTLRAALTRLAKPTKQSSDLMRQLGFNAFDSAGSMLPLHEVIGGLQKSTAGLTQQQRANAMATIFGQEAMSGMLALMEQGPDRMKSLTQSLYDSEGAAQKMADIRLDSMAGQMELLKSATDELKLSLGERLAPYTRSFVEWTTANIPLITDKVMDLVDKVQSFATKAYPAVKGFISGFKEMIPTITNIAPLILGIGSAMATIKIGNQIRKGIEYFSELKTLFSATAVSTGGVGKAIAVLMGPVGQAALVVGLLVAGFALAYKNSETFRNKVNELKNSFIEFTSNMTAKAIPIIKGIGTAFIEFAKPIIDTALPVIKNIAAALMEFASAAIPFVISGIDLLIGVFQALWVNILQPIAAYIGDVFSNTIQTAFTVIGSIVTNVIETISGVLSGFSLILSGISDFIVGVFTGNWEQAWEGIKGITEGTIEVIKSVFTGFIDFVKEIPGHMLDIGKNIMEGLANGIKTAISLPVNAIKNVSKSIIGGVKGALQIKSPSRVMMEYGGFTTEGLAKGMEERIPKLEAVVGTTYKVIAGEESNADRVSGRGSTIVERAVERIREIKPFAPKYDPDDPKPQPRPRVAIAGGGGTAIYEFNIGRPEFDFSGLGSGVNQEEVEEIVDEGLAEAGRKMLEALRDLK